MLKRFITSIFIILGLVAILLLQNTLAFNAALALLVVIGAGEIIKAFKFSKAQEVVVLAGFIPVILLLFFAPHSILLACLPFVGFFTAMYFTFCIVFAFPKFDFGKIGGVCFFVSLLIASFYSWVFLKNLFPYSKFAYTALYFIILGIAFSWGSDTMAYLAGMVFGKHKLAAVLSPKKTIEGAVGGVLGGVVIAEIITFVFANWFFTFAGGTALLYAAVAVAGVFACPISIVGDLFASAVKRQMGIKDYGVIFPGHGGVLDRFDSLLFVMPLVAFFAKAILLFAPGLWH